MILGELGRAHVITRNVMREQDESESERCDNKSMVRQERLEDAVREKTLKTLKMEEEAKSREMQVLFRSWKGQGSKFSSCTSSRSTVPLIP